MVDKEGMLRYRRVLLVVSLSLFSSLVSLFAQVSIAVFPLVSDGVPASSAAAQVSSIINNAVSNSSSGPFSATMIASNPSDFDPGVPPLASDSNGDGLTDYNGATYSFTSQLFYDSEGQQTQGQVWLYDNTTQTMVATDQFVYGTVDEATESAPFLIDYILGLIPTYTVNISVTEGGTVDAAASVPGDDSSASLHATDGTVKVHGSGILTLNETPDDKYTFENWTMNDTPPPLTDVPLKLTLTSTNYPASASDDDPWGTQVSLSVAAAFIENADSDSDDAADAAADTPPSPKWYAGLVYQPTLGLGGYLHDWKSDDESYTLLSFGLHGAYIPWYFGKHMSLGFGAFLGYEQYNLSESTTDGIFDFSLSAIYQLLFNWFEIDISLGGGLSQFINVMVPSVELPQSPTDFHVHAAIDFRFLIWKGLYASLGPRIRATFDREGMPMLEGQANVGIGYKF
jgi:hypothetical protein